jgi:WD40 repeat protein
MAPEQAAGKTRSVGPAADVYSLGAVLYDLLTGRPPFKSTTVMDTLRLVLTAEPVRPRQLVPSVPLDLQTICLKCLEKEPARRYAGALDLADDLRRFLDGKPVRARPVGLLGRGWRWGRRNPAVAGLLVAVATALLAGIAASSYFAVQAAERAVLAEAHAGEARTQQERAEWLAYGNQVCLSQREHERGMTAKARMILDGCRPELRHWEHAYLRNLGNNAQRVLKGPDGPVTLVAFRPDGSEAVSVGSDLRLRVWDGSTGKSGPAQVGHTRPILAAAFLGEGRQLASVGTDGGLFVWDRAGGGKLHSLLEGQAARAAAFSADGSLLVLAGSDGVLSVWAVSGAGEALRLHLNGGGHEVSRLALSTDARMLVAAAPDGAVVVWDLRTGQRLSELAGSAGQVGALAFSSDGSRLAVAAGNRATVWGLRRGEAVSSVSEHTGPVTCLLFSPDGRRLFSGGADQTVKVCEPERGQCLLTLEGHTAAVIGLAISPDGRRLTSVDRGGAARVWQAAPRPLHFHSGPI